jgi:hypothetical protein
MQDGQKNVENRYENQQRNAESYHFPCLEKSGLTGVWLCLHSEYKETHFKYEA